MKKLMMLSLLILFVFALFAEVMPVKTNNHPGIQKPMKTMPQKSISRDVPEWEWEVVPQDLLINYADYFQCYNHLPISLQPESHGGGLYIMYRVKDQAGNSEVSYTYVDNMGNVEISNTIEETGYYCDAVVDQETGDVFGTWHVAVGDPETYDCILTYDIYHLMGGPGLWKSSEITVLDGDEQADLNPTDNDEFIWPQVAIGPSPEEGMQRIYVVASNHNSADGDEANPSENVMIMYADFTTSDIGTQSNLDWSYNTIPVMDDWNAEEPFWYRPFKSFTVIDNQLIFMGYRIPEDDADEEGDQLFCFINDNYGEGDNWTYHYEDWWSFDEENPSWEWNDLTWHIFEDHTGYPDEPATNVYTTIEHSIINTGHFNLVPTHNRTCVTWAGAMGLTFDSGSGPGYYWTNGFQIYPKTFTFDLIEEEFSLCDVYPPGANPNDDWPAKPWDLDEDGEIDEFTADDAETPHYAQYFESWPIFHYDSEAAFHYNEYFLTTNEEQGWMAYLWVDGMMAFGANEGWSDYEGWAAKPEIAMCISSDWGTTWSDPIFMNANTESDDYVEELDGMIPCFAYPGDRIEDIGSGWGIVHLFFLDDNDYGSFHSQTQGLNNGSTFEYAAMKVYFGNNDSPVSDLAPVPVQVKNYPNPFNPTTTIAFETKEASQVNIDIYNAKGQLVNSLVNDVYDAGKHKVLWNGTDNNGNTLPSGVYLYKTRCGRYTTSKKMILMK